MSRVEERVVSMKFDNKQFASAAGETLSVLDKLKSAMNFKGMSSAISGAGFKDLDGSAKSAAESVKMVSDSMSSLNSGGGIGSLGASADTVSMKFGAMSAVALGAFASIGASAVGAAANLAKTFTLDPIMDGFREYETKMDAIQRIQANTASKGVSMDHITASLNDLNHYADQTIFNFGEMTDAIARFTAAGVDIDTATTSIKGLSNVAAMSGASAAESALVNKQIAQALGGGDVRLQDWMSVENAGMDNEAFKTTLYEAGKRLGKLSDVPMDQTFEEWTASGNRFRDTLKDGWLTTDVLNEALKNMSGTMTKEQLIAEGYSEAQAEAIIRSANAANDAATKVKTFSQLMDTLKESAGSAWAGMFEAIFGGLGDATKLWTGIKNVVEPILTGVPTAITNMFQEWAKLGGRENFMQGLIDGFKFLGGLLAPIGAAFREVFKPFTGGDLKNATDTFAKFMAQLTVSENAATTIKGVFIGVFTVLKVVLTVVGFLAKGLFLLGFSVAWVVEKLLQLPTAVVHAFQDFGQTVRNVVKFVDNLKEVLGNLGIDPSFLNFIPGMEGKIEGLADRIGNLRNAISILWSGDFNGSYGTWEESDAIVDKLFDVREAMQDTYEYWRNLSWEDVKFSAKTIGDAFKDVDFGSIEDIKKATATVMDSLTRFSYDDTLNALDNFQSALADKFDTIKEVFTNFRNIDFTEDLLNGNNKLEVSRLLDSLGLMKFGEAHKAIEELEMVRYQLAAVAMRIKIAIGEFDFSGLHLGGANANVIGRLLDDLGLMDENDAVLALWNIESIRTKIYLALRQLDFSNSDFFHGQNANIIGGLLEDLGIGNENDTVKILWKFQTMLNDIANYDFSGMFDKWRAQLFKLGSNIGQWITEAVANVDWNAVGHHLATGVVWVAGALIGALGVLGTLVWEFFKGLFTNIDLSPMLGIFEGMGPVIMKALGKVGEIIRSITETLAPGFKFLGSVISGAFTIVQAFVDAVAMLFDGLGEGMNNGLKGFSFEEWFNDLKAAIANIDFTTLLTTIGIALAGAGSAMIGKTVKDFGDKIAGIGDSISDVLDKISGQADEASKFQEFGDALMTVAKAMLVMAVAAILLAAALMIFGSIPLDNLKKGLVGLAGALGILAVMMIVITKLSGSMTDGLGKISNKKSPLNNLVTSLDNMMRMAGKVAMIMALSVAILAIAGALFIMSLAMERLSKLSWEEIGRGMTALVGMMLALAITVRMLPEKDLLKSAFAILMLSMAINSIQKGLAAMAKLSWEEIFRGMLALAFSMGILIAATKLLSDEDVNKVSGNFLLLAVALIAFAFALQMLDKVSWAAILKGFTVLAFVLGGMVAITKITKPGELEAVGKALILVSVGLLMLAMAIMVFDGISWETMLSGLLKIGASLLVFGFGLRAFPTGKVATSAVTIIAIAAAMVIMSYAIERLAGIDMAGAFKAVGMIMAILIALTVVTTLMGKIQGLGGGGGKGKAKGGMLDALTGIVKLGGTMVAAAVGIAAMAIALALLLPVLAGFAALGLGNIAIALVGISAAVLVLVAAGYLLQPVIGAFLGLGAAFLMFGAGVALLGAALWLVGAGLMMVAGALVLLKLAGEGAIAMLPLLGAGLAMLLVSFITTLGQMAPALSVAFVQIGTALLTAFIQLLPLVTVALIGLITAACQVIITCAPMVGQAFVVLVTTVLVSLMAVIPLFGEFIILVINEICRVVLESASVIIDSFIQLLYMVLEGLIQGATILGMAGPLIIAAFLVGFFDGVAMAIPQVVDGFLRMINAGVDGILAAQDGINEAIIRLLEGMTENIRQDGPRIRAAFRELLDEALKQIGIKIPDFKSIGIDIIAGFLRGLQEKWEELQGWWNEKMDWLKNSPIAKFFIRSPSRYFKKIGGYISEGLGLGIKNNTRPEREMDRTSQGVIDTAEKRLEIHSPSRVFKRIGGNINEGFAQGLDKTSGKPSAAMGRTLDGVINTAETKASVLDGILIRIAQLTPITAELNDIAKEAKKTRKEALEQRAKDAKEEEERLDDQILDAQDALADHKDSIKDAEDQKAAKKEEASGAKKDAKNERAKANEAKKSATEAQRDADKSRRDASKADRDLAKKRRDLAKKEKALREAEEEKAAYDANVKGYLAGKAFAEGTKSGLKDAHEEILSEEEIFVNLLTEKIKEYKEEVSDFTGLFDGMKTLRDITKSTGDNVEELGRAFARLNSSSNDRSALSALDDMLESLIGIGDAFEKIFEIYDKLQPFLVPLMMAITAAMPAIAAAFPALASSGAVGAAPVIAAIGGIILAFIALVIFLDDFNKEQKIARLIISIFDGVVKFIGSIPRRIASLIRSVGEGLVKFIRFIPELLPSILKAILDAMVEFVVYLPVIIAELILAIFDVIVELLTAPDKIADMIVRFIQAIILAFKRMISLSREVYGELGARMADHIVEGFKRVGASLMYWLNPLNWFKPREVSQVKDLGELFGENYSEGFLDAMNHVFTMQDLDPTIRPEMDLGGIEAGMKRANGMMNFDTGYGTSLAADINSTMSAKAVAASPENKDAGGNSIEYNQFITAPNPISTIDVYRGTQKQLQLQGSLAGSKTINTSNAPGSIGSTDALAGDWFKGLFGRK